MNIVLVMFKDGERREFPLSQSTTMLGRRQDCDLRIPTRDVSRRHCELVVRKNSLMVRDLGSSNGTFVNGKRIAEHELEPGDRLRVGPVTFVVQINGKPVDIKPEEVHPPSDVTPTTAGGEDEETFELTEEDYDLDDALSALEEPEEDEEGLP